MIPTPESWTVIFSKMSTAWGSFTYNQKEDALRVTVKPQAAEMHEALTYDFDDVKPDSAVVTLRWEKVAVPFTVKADQEATLANIRNQLRNGPQYLWNGWDDAATWCADNKTNLEEALRWTDRSIQIEERFENLMTKARILKELQRVPPNRPPPARRRWKSATHCRFTFTAANCRHRRRRLRRSPIYRMVAKRFPDHWLGHLAKARAAVADADFATAMKETQAAQAGGAGESRKPQLEGSEKAHRSERRYQRLMAGIVVRSYPRDAATAPTSSVSVWTTTRLRPWAFAWYSASSASRIRTSGAQSLEHASPMLQVIASGRESARKGVPARASRRRSACTRAAAASQPGSTTRNSSPP